MSMNSGIGFFKVLVIDDGRAGVEVVVDVAYYYYCCCYSYYYSYYRAAPQPRQKLITLAATGGKFGLCCNAVFKRHASIKRWKQI